jgi:dCTP deaminase
MKTQSKPIGKTNYTLLNDMEITELATQSGMIEPFQPDKVSQLGETKVLSYGLEPFGYTLTASFNKYKRTLMRDGFTFVGGKHELEWLEEEPMTYEGKKWLVIPPNDFILCSVVEMLRLPPTVQAQFLTKSTLARYGLFGNVTWIDAGWHGYLTVEMANLGRNYIAIPCGEGIGQVVFYRGNMPARPYSGRYQNQQELPQEAIL